jgi:hypothetical protein
LKEHVSRCYSQFTVSNSSSIQFLCSCLSQAFSVARIEHNTLRIEQTAIINHVENQVKARRLEGMMAQVLLDTPFGQNVMNRTVEIISAVSAFNPCYWRNLTFLPRIQPIAV